MLPYFQTQTYGQSVIISTIDWTSFCVWLQSTHSELTTYRMTYLDW